MIAHQITDNTSGRTPISEQSGSSSPPDQEIDMDPRGFNKNAFLSGLGARAALTEASQAAFEPNDRTDEGDCEGRAGRKLPIRRYGVVVAGGGTAGMFSALAIARQGARRCQNTDFSSAWPLRHRTIGTRSYGLHLL